MKTGGSNYITINGIMDNPIIGTYHLFQDRVAADLQEMFEHGQRKIALLCWFLPANFPAAHDNLWHHCVNSYGGVMCEQHRTNVTNLLALIASIGFTEVAFRFGPQGNAMDSQWFDAQGRPAWNAPQFNENWNFIRSVSELVLASKGSLNVVLDLGVEHANERITTSQVHNLYCREIWRRWTLLHPDTNYSCAFSILHGGGGLMPMLRAFKIAKLPNPSFYCFDVYDVEYDTLISAKSVLLAANEQLKPVYILETNYNDATSCADIKRAVAETSLNFNGVFQWPKVRDGAYFFTSEKLNTLSNSDIEQLMSAASPSDFPDVYPKRYDNYLVEI